jgi:hypothetical protein
MRDDLAERLVNHPGELGCSREEILRQFLRAYLPRRFDVSTGFAIDSKGAISEQLDVIIADSLVCPTFLTAGGVRAFPCESIVAVGQVKSSLTSLRTFRAAMANLESVKQLDRSAGGTAVDSRFGESIDQTKHHLHQIFTFLFITGKSLSRTTLQEEMLDHVTRTDAHLWPNVVFVLDKLLATYCCDQGVCPNPMDARGIAVQPETGEDAILMKFYVLLAEAIAVTRVCALPAREYLKVASPWSADVFYVATGDDPPPYLGSLRIG